MHRNNGYGKNKASEDKLHMIFVFHQIPNSRQLFNSNTLPPQIQLTVSTVLVSYVEFDNHGVDLQEVNYIHDAMDLRNKPEPSSVNIS